ncbi:hypothetical protein N9076_00005, partial [bacterium]|nr:hypothetical protein [bacterium]
VRIHFCDSSMMAPLSWKDTIVRKTKLSLKKHKSIHDFCPDNFLLAAWGTWPEVEKASAGSFQNNLYLNDKGPLISNKMVKERLKEIA